MSRGKTITTTSYAILSLLAMKPWTTYELTQQMSRSLGRIWPRAQSKLYEEPKKLVDAGLARARKDAVGLRPRTVYSITPAGRRALALWLQQPGEGPVLEFEQLLQVSFAENGSKQDALSTLAAARAWALERNQENLATAKAYVSGTGPFPDRLAQNMLAGRFLTDFYALVDEWSRWATAQVEAWPDDPAQAVPDEKSIKEIARRADW